MEENIPLSAHTTFKLGGPARYFFRAHNTDELKTALTFAREKKLPFFVLGGGSNLLVSDAGFSGVVIKNEIRGASFTDAEECVRAEVGAGETWDAFVAECVRRELFGVENLSGIPGTVGAAPVQNIGAYGTEVKDVIESVEVLDSATGEARTMTNALCRFAYRDSVFKTPEGKRLIITQVMFRFRKNGVPNLAYKDLAERIKNKESGIKKGEPTLVEVREAVLEIRSKKFPDLRTTGTAGSFFKNPIISQSEYDALKKKFPDIPGFEVSLPHSNLEAKSYPPERSRAGKLKAIKIPLAWILDHILHLKGFAVDGAALHDVQPLVLINTGTASATAVRRLAEDIAARVKDATGLTLEWEVESL